jgi:lipoprotein-anchoring transpeptidase ErfK/SrfK
MKRKILASLVVAAGLAGATAEGWAANLVARVELSTQTMTVSYNGQVLHRWPVSTARRGFVTPRGTWKPTRMHKMWYSRKYDMSPMPYSVFYHGGYAIHGTNYVKNLGKPASHGCVRLHTANAATFYSLVQQVGSANTRITVVN